MKLETRNSKPIDAIIFDIDGVLVDVSQSYRVAIIQTVDIFFAQGLGLRYEEDPISLLDAADIDSLKLAGGFNNDWDLTTAFIIYFADMLPPLSMPTFPLKRHVPAMLAYLQIASGGKLKITMDTLRRKKNISQLAQQIAEQGGGLPGLKQALPSRNRHLIFNHGDLLKENLIQRIFQEIYLGQKLFAETYDEDAVVVQTDGVINNETLLINPAVLKNLAKTVSLGIATGRPRAEAEYTLKRLGIAHYFQSMVTHDEVVLMEAEGKPAPWQLLEAARYLDPVPARSAYVGDTPDDIRAAKAANRTVPFLAIGTLAAAQNKAALRYQFQSLHANLILNHPDELQDVIRLMEIGD